jgi:ATP-binding cassette subfamily F protein uup
VQLAALLMGDWDVIALDEPTGTSTVSRGLPATCGNAARNSGGLLGVTHDRWFLDEVPTTMWEVHDGIVDPLDGG